MISFKKLEITNFKSIEKASLQYDKGVWLVVGINNDAIFQSNGSGKTTAMEAIQQCLFNKTTSPTPIEDTSRKTDGATKHIRKYKLELTFESAGSTYLVINDRKLMHIRILKDGKDLLMKSIPNSLKYLQDVIGMDFQTFITLTFINHDTIVDLLDNFSSSSLMKIILNFSQIISFEKTAKTEQKVVNQSIAGVQSQLQTLRDSLSVLGNYVEIDVTPILQSKLLAKKALGSFVTDELPNVEALENSVCILQDELLVHKAKVIKDSEFLSSSKCSCCSTLMNITESERKVLSDNLIALGLVIVSRTKVLEEEKIVASSARDTYLTRYAQLYANSSDIDNRLLVAKTKNALYLESKEQADTLRERLVILEAELQNLQIRSDVIQVALSVIKTGDIQKDLLDTFVLVLNTHILKFIQFVSLNYIHIVAESTKSNVSFKIHDTRFNQAISIHTLSGGEKTRLRLVVLLAMLYTIKDLADISTNLLVFDESLDTLDTSATKDLANLFSYLVNNDDKFIAMVSHGSQLSEIEFTGSITAIKTNGSTSLSQEVL